MRLTKLCRTDIRYIDLMNSEALNLLGIKLETRDVYAIEYVEELLENYRNATGLDTLKFVSEIGHRKGFNQKQYQELQGYLERLKKYARQIEICGEERNSYSKTVTAECVKKSL